mgnify:CR=1 FL=1
METVASTFDQELGARLRAMRRRAGLSLAGLAGRAGPPFSMLTLSRIERGVRPIRASELVRVAQALEVPPEHILVEQPLPDPLKWEAAPTARPP